MLDNQKTNQQQAIIYLPAQLSSEQIPTWQNIPPEHFLDSSFWLNRSQIKEMFGVSERSYFRWISTLEQHGLSRSLPAEQDKKVRLFYRKDLEDAAMAARNAATKEPHRGRKPKALSAPATEQFGALPTTEQIVTGRSERVATDAEIATLRSQLLSQATHISLLQAEVAHFKHQLDLINQKQALMAEQLPQSRIIEILSRFAGFDHFTAAIKKFNSHINKLTLLAATTSTKSNKSKSRPKSKQAKGAKGAKKSRAKATTKVATRTKGKQKSKLSAPAHRSKK
jgi:hypothetical protein